MAVVGVGFYSQKVSVGWLRGKMMWGIDTSSLQHPSLQRQPQLAFQNIVGQGFMALADGKVEIIPFPTSHS